MAKFKAYSYASGTIINAIAAGRGSAFALDLKAEAIVELIKGADETVEIYTYSGEGTSLAELCVKKVLEKANMNCGVKLVITSDIPVAQGLSSSSAVSNAIVLATATACRLKLKEEELIKLGVECSIEAGVSITGALDDASASFLGGITYTDNLKGEILKREPFPQGYTVLILLSQTRSYTRDVDKKRAGLMKEAADSVFEKALGGDFLNALTLNGILYSSILKYNPEPIYDMLSAGASAAGLTGTGPAFIAVVKNDLVEKVRESVQRHGSIIESKPMNVGAKAMPILL